MLRRTMVMILTLLDSQVAHSEGHGVTTEDIVTTVNVVPVDGESSTAGYRDHTLDVL